jgi:hypothetical protein
VGESAELHETWTTRELPILRAALARLDRGDDYADLDELRVELGLTAGEIFAAVDALGNASPPYLDVDLRNGWDGVRSPGTIDRVYERTRRELGTWPTAENVVADIAAALRTAAEEADEPQETNRLRAAADALTGFARDVAVAVVARHVGG